MPVELLILGAPSASKLFLKSNCAVEFNTADTGRATAPTVVPIPIFTPALGVPKRLEHGLLADRLPLCLLLTLLRGVPREVPRGVLWRVHRELDVPGGSIGTRGVPRRGGARGVMGGSMPLLIPFRPYARSS